MNGRAQPRLRVAVIGAGWAGLAAAEALAPVAEVSLFEAGKQPGGRARAVTVGDSGFAFLDNGQHLLLGAYHQSLALLARAGVAEADAFVRLPLSWHLADGIRFQAARLPAPWHMLWGIVRGQGMRLPEKWALLLQMRALQRWYRAYCRHGMDISVGQWLHQNGVGQKWQQQFWQPLVWGSLNTALAEASCARLGHVLADGVWRGCADSDMLLAKGDLQHSWVGPVTRHVAALGVAVHCRSRIDRLQPAGHGIRVGEADFDRVVVAVAPYHVAALLPENTPPALLQALARLRYHAITTVYLRYPCPVRLPQTLTGLVSGTAQWLIDRGALGGDGHEVAAVVSLADQYGNLDTAAWAARVHQDLLRLCAHLPPPEAVRVITEKRATVCSSVAAPALPQQAWLRAQGVYLAGDYLHPRYPATLEAAVQSGRAAAEACLADWQQAPQPRWKRM